MASKDTKILDETSFLKIQINYFMLKWKMT